MGVKMSMVMCECKLHLSANKKHIYILSYILANILDQYIFWNSDAGGCTPKILNFKNLEIHNKSKLKWVVL